MEIEILIAAECMNLGSTCTLMNLSSQETTTTSDTKCAVNRQKHIVDCSYYIIPIKGCYLILFFSIRKNSMDRLYFGFRALAGKDGFGTIQIQRPHNRSFIVSSKSIVQPIAHDEEYTRFWKYASMVLVVVGVFAKD
ncbi:hypothetical protein FRX31_027787 [Thalictrum thalictroides]|uniref:RING-type E3 ubiquitin transferase n=1 Tax=Thalictrum thalictroides TaxID=46969 RepID=A0A7J6VDE3_THATH|nr:hypothetical protein FRX31_027787 [Thalictrum thalictroides]